jgi:hypothetical protein
VADERIAPEHEVLLHLQGLDGPVTTQQLRDHAAGAPPRVVAALEQLPDRTWPNIEDAAAAIGTGWRTDSS